MTPHPARREKKCKACPTRFVPSRPLQVACCPACAQAIAQRNREKAARQAPMPGVTLPTFVCVSCKRRSVTKGCKQLSVGRICAACKAAREARRGRQA